MESETQRGITLIELMATVAVFAILLAVGVPNLKDFYKNSLLTNAGNALTASLNLARIEAVKRGKRVTVCISADGATCASNGGWQQGWLVFTDSNHDAAYDPDNEILLRTHESFNGQITMTGNGNVSSYISYVASGQSQLVNGAFQAGSIKICDDRSGSLGRKLVLSQTGRLRLDTEVSCP